MIHIVILLKNFLYPLQSASRAHWNVRRRSIQGYDGTRFYRRLELFQPAVRKVVDILFLIAVFRAPDADMRLKREVVHWREHCRVALFGVYTVVFVLHDRVTEIAEEVKIYESTVGYELIDMEIQLLKGSLRSSKSEQFRVKLLLHKQTVPPFGIADSLYYLW